MNRARKGLLALTLTVGLSACAPPTRDLAGPPADLGAFRLGYNVVVVPNARALPGSRKATEAEWKTALTRAIDARFGRYDGDRPYHFGISVDAYNLAAVDLPGIPTPKSALAITVTVWDGTRGVKLNENGKTITVLGVFSGAGIQPTRQVQLDNLSALAAKSIEKWLLENPGWFAAAE